MPLPFLVVLRLPIAATTTSAMKAVLLMCIAISNLYSPHSMKCVNDRCACYTWRVTGTL